jgi:hypothetical protein
LIGCMRQKDVWVLKALLGAYQSGMHLFNFYIREMK